MSATALRNRNSGKAAYIFTKIWQKFGLLPPRDLLIYKGEKDDEKIVLTKEKVKYIVKRLSYFSKMQAEGVKEADYRISKRKEHLVLDEEVLAVIGVMEEIIESEETKWLQDLLKEVRYGRKDVTIQIDSPVARTKYYQTKERFVNKVYECCIYKGYVSYEDILKNDIG